MDYGNILFGLDDIQLIMYEIDSLNDVLGYRLWKEPDGTFWMRCRWYMIPEETAVGRQPHNLRRELYRTNHYSDVEVNINNYSSFVSGSADHVV